MLHNPVDLDIKKHACRVEIWSGAKNPYKNLYRTIEGSLARQSLSASLVGKAQASVKCLQIALEHNFQHNVRIVAFLIAHEGS